MVHEWDLPDEPPGSFPSEEQIAVHTGIVEYIASQEAADNSDESTEAEPLSVAEAVVATVEPVEAPVLPLSTDLEHAVTDEDVVGAETARDDIVAKLSEITEAYEGVTAQQDALEEFIAAIAPDLIPVAEEALSNKDAWLKSHDKVKDDTKGSFNTAAKKLREGVDALTGAGEADSTDETDETDEADEAEAETTDTPEVSVTSVDSLEFIATFAEYVRSANAVKKSHDEVVKAEKEKREAEEAATSEPL